MHIQSVSYHLPQQLRVGQLLHAYLVILNMLHFRLHLLQLVLQLEPSDMSSEPMPCATPSSLVLDDRDVLLLLL